MAALDLSSRLAGVLARTKSLYVSACAAEVCELPDLWAASGLRDAVVTALFSPLVNHRSYCDAERGIRTRTFLLPRALKGDMARGLVEFCPWRYSMIDRWMREPGRFDTAMVMLSPPDADGLCSLGPQADFFPSFHRDVKQIIGLINPHLPRTAGHEQIPFKSLALAIDYDFPLLEMDLRPGDAASDNIARLIAERVPDGATVQLGTGQLPSQVLARLAGHRNLSIHTGIIDDNILKLEAAGALDPSKPIVTGTAIGTRVLYDSIADQKRFALKPVAFTHAYANIAGADRFTAVNSVLQVDLLGQVSGEAIGGRIAASPGGLPDFVRGAQDSPGGQAIIAVRASGEGARADGVTSIIDTPSVVTNGAVEAHIIVTEFGVADVRGLSMDRRAEAIIGIAAPNSRDRLADEWRALRSQFFGSGRPPLLKQAAV